jgi:hypothetical protein
VWNAAHTRSAFPLLRAARCPRAVCLAAFFGAAALCIGSGCRPAVDTQRPETVPGIAGCLLVAGRNGHSVARTVCFRRVRAGSVVPARGRRHPLAAHLRLRREGSNFRRRSRGEPPSRSRFVCHARSAIPAGRALPKNGGPDLTVRATVRFIRPPSVRFAVRLACLGVLCSDRSARHSRGSSRTEDRHPHSRPRAPAS